MQKCVECGELFPFTEDFFYKQPRSKGNLRKICKKCFNENVKEYKRREEVIKAIKSKNKTVEYNNIDIIKARKNLGLTKLETSKKLSINFRTYEAIEGTQNKRINKKISKVNYKKICDFFKLYSE